MDFEVELCKLDLVGDGDYEESKVLQWNKEPSVLVRTELDQFSNTTQSSIFGLFGLHWTLEIGLIKEIRLIRDL